LVAGAAGAAGAAGVASGAGAGAGAAVGAGFCSSAFLHPTTAKDNAATKNREIMTANTFFIWAPPFYMMALRDIPRIAALNKSQLFSCQDNFIIILE
jgi:hypothetical protein